MTRLREFLRNSGPIAGFNRTAAPRMMARHDLVAMPVPFDVSPLTDHLIWHRRLDPDPAPVEQRN
ncbi:hypothetical protein [Poseidonocella sedimentorum]|uniref:hypothetical protein n=1 Tax=Poseidonocella sedimentorum TaxID=871652 RepID=UPI00116084A9|nr:hypothetical protein [Poseidonocella sedimentorum]